MCMPFPTTLVRVCSWFPHHRSEERLEHPVTSSQELLYESVFAEEYRRRLVELHTSVGLSDLGFARSDFQIRADQSIRSSPVSIPDVVDGHPDLQ
jgi:hypothetical protein